MYVSCKYCISPYLILLSKLILLFTHLTDFITDDCLRVTIYYCEI